jgi:hypothetical protein
MIPGRPVRLQLSRKKGFSLQALSRATNGLDAINVARPNRDGNQYIIGIDGDREYCVWKHRKFIETAQKVDPQAVGLMAVRLRGKNLACWCPLDGSPCHADVLLEIANR